ncbi:MAG: chemotaxis protein CheA [Pseudomonadota bacterium]
MDPMEEIRETFFIECEELLEAMEAGLLAMSEGDDDGETVNAVFRAVHSIKGGAGAFGLDELVRFAHTFETTLDEVRAERLNATEEVLSVLLRAGDVLSDLVAASRDGANIDSDAISALIGELHEIAGSTGDDDASNGDADDEEFESFTPMSLDFGLDDSVGDDGSTSNAFDISFKPHKALYERGNDTTLLLRALSDIGTVTSTCNAEALPSFSDFDPEEVYLTWTVCIETEQSETEISEIFEFVEGDCDLAIETVENNSNILSAFESDSDDQESETIAPASAELEDIAAVDGNDDTDATNTEDVSNSIETPNQAPKEETPAEKKTSVKKASPKDQQGGAKATVRVDLERVDRLINLVGELVINQAMLSELAVDAGMAQNSSLATGFEEFKQLTREIQESVMAIRAQPVKSLFQRMSRIVREASSATNKSVILETDGESTEVDKTVIERLADPLTHMIRNAVDHGLETPEKRIEAGKDERGTVRLSAAHRSGRVMIEIADDGAGINRERVKQIAIDKNLISPDADLSNSEIDNLLFMPGFSTAKEVSDLSGRGVGMDVVKRAIQALGGRINISSTPGKGSTFSISLPLTLAVLDGMVVNVADQTLVVPLNSIVETLKPHDSDIHVVCDDATTVLIRGTFVPVIDVGFQLGYREPLEQFNDTVMILVETEEGAKTALLVDAIQDQRQVVIKGLEENYGHVPGIAAATILGDGRIALILDADAIVSSLPSVSPDDIQMQMAG